MHIMMPFVPQISFFVCVCKTFQPLDLLAVKSMMAPPAVIFVFLSGNVKIQCSSAL